MFLFVSLQTTFVCQEHNCFSSLSLTLKAEVHDVFSTERGNIVYAGM